MMQHRKRIVGRKGFTLVEVMLVLFIMMVLATIAIGSVTMVRAQAKVRQAAITVGQLATAVERYESIYDILPETLEDLWSPPQTLDATTTWSPITRKVESDPWGQPFYYQYPSQDNNCRFDVWSSGPDGQTGTADDIIVSR